MSTDIIPALISVCEADNFPQEIMCIPRRGMSVC